MNLILRTALVMSLSVGVLATLLTLSKIFIVKRGQVIVKINGQLEILGEKGDSLLSVLHVNDIQIPAPCAGRGTCKRCMIKVKAGGDEPTAIEKTRLSPEELDMQLRLACQIKLSGDMEIEIESEFISKS